MSNYLNAWRAFRSLGNEPEATAAHLTTRPTWPRRSDLSLLDIGAGDGSMAAAIVRESANRIRNVSLLDPEHGLLQEAEENLRANASPVSVRTVLGCAEKEGLSHARECDVAVVIHTAYLIDSDVFRQFVEEWPASTPLFVVVDAPGSVFSNLWSLTAPKFALRTARVHELFGGETGLAQPITASSFSTSLPNPLSLSDADSASVLSLLCYSDYEMLAADTKLSVREVLSQYMQGERLNCECTCYAMG